MAEQKRNPDMTTIAPDVLINIVRLTALDVPGVHQLAPAPSSVDLIFKRGAAEGVLIKVENGIVDADLYVVLSQEINVRDVSRSIQNQVARAITEMVGMEVGKINIHVEDIHYSEGDASKVR